MQNFNRIKKLRVGVWINDWYVPEVGGGFGYYQQIINGIREYQFSNIDIVFISRKKKDFNPGVHTYKFLKNKLFKKSVFTLFKKRPNFEAIKNELSEIVDVIYYAEPSCDIPYFPFVYTLWDLGHLISFPFPEVSMNGIYEKRKLHYDRIIPKALMVIVESMAGAEHAIKYMNVANEKIRVLPLIPSEIINQTVSAVQPNIEKNTEFIHYPAQYWAHKNHYNLIVAFKMVVEKFPNLKLVLTGADKGNKNYIMHCIEELNLKNSIIDLGFVSFEELKWIYQNSKGLVMPTFFGPTNMPLLEAAILGCKVACSDLPGHREQLGEYGFYFNPGNPVNISETIIKMIDEKSKNVYPNTFEIKNTISRLESYFEEVSTVRFTWGKSDQIF